MQLTNRRERHSSGTHTNWPDQANFTCVDLALDEEPSMTFPWRRVQMVVAPLAALQAMEGGALRERQAADGASPGVVTPEQLAALLKADFDMWGGVIRRLGIALD